MTDQGNGQTQGAGEKSASEGSAGSGIGGALASNPATQRLLKELEQYLSTLASGTIRSVGGKASELAESAASGQGAGGKAAIASGVERLSEGGSPASALAKAGRTGLEEKAKRVFQGRRGGGKTKVINIIEDIDIGVPVRVAYDQWTQFQEFSKFTKGVESAERTDDVKAHWKVKIAFSHRDWESTINEEVPDERIAWTSRGRKGSVDGVVTFHEIAPRLTRVILVLEYHPQGFFEKTGNLWRAQGRRARLDLKHFRRFVMQHNEATGSWRGEIRDGQIVRSHEDAMAEEEQANQGEQANQEEQEGQGEQEGQEQEEQAEGGEQQGQGQEGQEGQGQEQQRRDQAEGGQQEGQGQAQQGQEEGGEQAQQDQGGGGGDEQAQQDQGGEG